MLPRVTGTRLVMKKLYHPAPSAKFAVATLAVASFAAMAGLLAAKMPRGMKNMLATLCSKPMVTKAMIGNQQAKILLITSSELIASQTARQTSQLQPIPRRNAVLKSRPHLVLATVAAQLAQGRLSK